MLYDSNGIFDVGTLSPFINLTILYVYIICIVQAAIMFIEGLRNGT